ncbi:MAG: DUF4968 domain-containing protein [Lachnoclostridium sp.]|nr:DUF4968 domain-containing protein [Lachnoclostridium sp.]
MIRKILLSVCLLAGSLLSQAQLISLPRGAKITLDTITTEITVLTPRTVRVTKYTGATPELYIPNIFAGNRELPDSLRRVEEAGKLKIDTGNFYAAINAKDGNVSFWNHEGQLILAEQHRTGKITSTDKNKYAVSQDFQIGKSQADSIYCPGAGVNLKGARTKLCSPNAPQSMVSTDKGYQIHWNSPGDGYIDDTPGRDVKKPGDVTFSSPSTTAIDYFFIIE